MLLLSWWANPRHDGGHTDEVGLRISLHVTPGASRASVGGTHGDALRVRVQARAVDGAATEAALVAVADAFGVHRREVTLEVGPTSRAKVVAVNGDETALTARLNELRRAP